VFYVGLGSHWGSICNGFERLSTNINQFFSVANGLVLQVYRSADVSKIAADHRLPPRSPTLSPTTQKINTSYYFTFYAKIAHKRNDLTLFGIKFGINSPEWPLTKLRLATYCVVLKKAVSLCLQNTKPF
jgi:hypothetical protein